MRTCGNSKCGKKTVEGILFEGRFFCDILCCKKYQSALYDVMLVRIKDRFDIVYQEMLTMTLRLVNTVDKMPLEVRICLECKNLVEGSTIYCRNACKQYAFRR
jgi:hypothetical protein